MGSLLNNHLTHQLAGSGLHVSASQLQTLNSSNTPPALRSALSSSISHVFLVGGLIVSLAFFASFFLKEIPLKTSHDYPTASEGGAPGAPPATA
jgi:hypothetical protein